MDRKAEQGEPAVGTGQPKVEAYPVCSACSAPYILRRCFLIYANRVQWLWQRDCKCKRASQTIRQEAT